MPGYTKVLNLGKLPHPQTWKRLIRAWGKVMNRYLTVECLQRRDKALRDLPHWHIERSHTGFLAAAVWEIGGVALEEYSTRRYSQSGTRKRRVIKPGRCDLYFNVGRLNAAIEAKHTWSLNEIEDRLRDAKDQLKSLPRNERADVGMQLCWMIPALTRNLKKVNDFLKHISKKFNNDRYIVAVYLVPERERTRCKDGQQYPGVIWIGRLQWPRRK